MEKETSFWSPSEDQISNANLTSFISFINKKKGLKFQKYNDLYFWSITNITDFWQSIWEYGSFIHSKSFDSVLKGNDIRTAQWFSGARLNFAENLLKYRDDKKAIVYWSETGERNSISFNELYKEVSAVAQFLRNQGVKKGDRIAAFITNRPEAIVGMLATASIGAIWSSCSPDFGVDGVLDRFGQIEPKVLIAIENYQYNGKKINCIETIDRISNAIDSIENVILINSTNSSLREKEVIWDDIRTTPNDRLIFEQLPFDHPLYIMYSSGTTGKPKCIVHGAGGTLIQHFKEHSLHTNVKEGDVITFYTTCGWMMWNWLVSGLMTGATVFLYDGSPMFPDQDILFMAIEEVKIKVFGTSPKFLSTCESKGLIPREKFDLNSLEVILSTGSPISEGHFNYVQQSIKPDIQLSSISGGTDILSCFFLGNPILPIFKGELQCIGLGMKVETFNFGGEKIENEIGELVCTAPFPSRPLYFWKDDKGEKYQRAYFDDFEGVWRHGDFIKINERGGCIVYGRSDATLNAGGIRIGTSEIYGVVESMDEILDSIVVGVEYGDDTRVVLFVVMNLGYEFSAELKQKINKTLRKSRSPRHVPSQIFQVKDIPRTISGKKVELAVRKTLQGELIDNKDALANPESLDQFSEYANII
ncbi:MAG: acetoacetate--CoA ligase [Reichenbachiella sp.]